MTSREEPFITVNNILYRYSTEINLWYRYEIRAGSDSTPTWCAVVEDPWKIAALHSIRTLMQLSDPIDAY